MKKTIVRRQVLTEIALPGLSPLLQKIYAHRGVTSSDALERDLSQLLPFQTLRGIDAAAECLAEALIAQQHITIIGDFDADGATSAALAVNALRAMGAQRVDYLVPNRFTFGYGLTPEIVEVALERKPDLLITVDNGISSLEGVAHAKKHGLKVIITDHHLPGSALPLADAIVNPNQPEDHFASKSIAGVGVIFYVMLALRQKCREKGLFHADRPEPNMAQFLDLVALGTVADVVALDKNNRVLVHQGVQRIRQRKCRPGILALLTVAGRMPERIVASDLGFSVGPRLNAAGRLQDMSLGIECLLAEDFSQAMTMAQSLDQLNVERRVIEAEMGKQALDILQELHLTPSATLPVGLCLFDEEWHQGVIGILASRMKDRLHRPVIVFASANETELKGSGRSISGVHLRDVLDSVAKRHPTLLYKFGGHAMAAGLTLKRAYYSAFCEAFDEAVRAVVTPQLLQREIYTDGILSASECTLAQAEALREGGPWGQGFPEPLFDGQFKILDQRLVGEKHLKMTLQNTEGQQFDAIAFNIDLDRWPNQRAQHITAAYRLDVNEYRGVRSVQLVLEYLEETSGIFT